MINPAGYDLIVIGGGLAGSEAAWQAAKAGSRVLLFEMKPVKFSPAHHTDMLAELVCSNSLRSSDCSSAVGLLKQEMLLAGSLVMDVALKTAVPAGKALAVDRGLFAREITKRIEQNPLIDIVRQEVVALDFDVPVVVAAGPLCSDALAKSLSLITKQQYLHFYDAIAPIVLAESIDMNKSFRQSRYAPQGEGDYLNCPMTQDEYDVFVRELVAGKKAPLHDFEDPRYFEGCLPVEVMAERGHHTLRFGPMKPVGLLNPHTNQESYAVVQLRPENRELTMYNMVGFQTKLTWTEQERIFRMIPGLENAEFLRLGSIHRNTFVCAPEVLLPTLQLKNQQNFLIAGQLSGVEGYVESTAMGWVAGVNAARLAQKKELVVLPELTAHGSLVRHLTQSNSDGFQPMNVNFGLFVPIGKKMRKSERGAFYAQRALDAWHEFLKREQLS